MAKPKELQERLDAVRQLLLLFRAERLVHLCVTIISLLVLLVSAAFLLSESGEPRVLAIGLFGASGGLTYTTSRLLRMWNQAFAAILGSGSEKENGSAQ